MAGSVVAAPGVHGVRWPASGPWGARGGRLAVGGFWDAVPAHGPPTFDGADQIRGGHLQSSPSKPSRLPSAQQSRGAHHLF